MLTEQTSMKIGESLLISGVGLCVVIIELFLLALFVILLAKAVKAAVSRKSSKEHSEAISISNNDIKTLSASNQSESNIKRAAALSACFAECGVSPKSDELLIVKVENKISGGT